MKNITTVTKMDPEGKQIEVFLTILIMKTSTYIASKCFRCYLATIAIIYFSTEDKTRDKLLGFGRDLRSLFYNVDSDEFSCHCCTSVFTNEVCRGIISSFCSYEHLFGYFFAQC